MANRDFLRKVLKGEKKLLKVSECKFVNVPKFDELGVNNIFPKFKSDPDVMLYLQDDYPKNKYPDRTYFYTVLNTVHPDYVRDLIAHANKSRFAPEAEKHENQTVAVTEEWWDQLNSLPFLSSKCHFLSNTRRV